MRSIEDVDDRSVAGSSDTLKAATTGTESKRAGHDNGDGDASTISVHGGSSKLQPHETNGRQVMHSKL